MTCAVAIDVPDGASAFCGWCSSISSTGQGREPVREHRADREVRRHHDTDLGGRVVDAGALIGVETRRAHHQRHGVTCAPARRVRHALGRREIDDDVDRRRVEFIERRGVARAGERRGLGHVHERDDVEPVDRPETFGEGLAQSAGSSDDGETFHA